MKNSRKLIALLVCLVLAVLAIAAIPSSAAVGNISGQTSKYSQPIYVGSVESGATLTQIRIPGSSAYGVSGYADSIINAVEVPAGSSQISLEVLNCGTYNYSKTTMGSAALKYNTNHASETVVAAMNGDPWIMYHTDYDGDGVASTGSSVKHVSVPRSLLVIDGEIWNTQQCDDENNLAKSNNAERGTPAAKQVAFCVLNDGTYVIGAPEVAVTFANISTGKTFAAAGINRLPAPNSVIIYNHRGGASSQAYSDAYEVYITTSNSAFGFGKTTTGTVKAIYANGNTATRPAVDANTIVISARGSAISSISGKFSVGQTVNFTASATADHSGHTSANLGVWNNVRDAIGGFYELLKNGTLMGEQSNSTVYPAPMIGIKADGTAVMATVTSSSEGSRYATRMKYLPSIAKELGMVNCIMFDGGGSTQMITLEGTSYVKRATSSDSSGVRAVISGVAAVYHGTGLTVTNNESGSVKLLTSNIASTTPIETVYHNVSAIDTMNGVSDGSYAKAGSPVVTTLKGSLTSDFKLALKGWSIVNGGVNGGIHYSVDGGTTWIPTTGTYSTAEQAVLDSAKASSTFTNVSGTNGRFDVTADLSAYEGQIVDVRFASVSVANTFSHFLTVENVQVGTVDSGGSGSGDSGSSGGTTSTGNVSTAFGYYAKVESINGTTTSLIGMRDPSYTSSASDKSVYIKPGVATGFSAPNNTVSISGWALVNGSNSGNFYWSVDKVNWTACTGTTLSATTSANVTTATSSGAIGSGSTSKGAFSGATADLSAYAGQTVDVYFATTSPLSGYESSYLYFLTVEDVYVGQTSGGDSGEVTTAGQNTGSIDYFNGTNVTGYRARPGTPLSASLPAPMTTNMFTIQGWCVAEGGYNGGIVYSLDGGKTWADTTGTYEENPGDGDAIVNLAKSDGLTTVTKTNCRFSVGVDLSAYKGKTVTVTFGINTSSTSQSISTFATITDVAVPATTYQNSMILWNRINGVDSADSASSVHQGVRQVALPSTCPMTSTSFSIMGWAIVNGGQQSGGIKMSTDGGATWRDTTGGSYNSTDVSGITAWITANGATYGVTNTTSINANFGTVSVDLSDRAGMLTNVTVGIKQSDGTVRPMVTFTGVQVPGDHVCTAGNTVTSLGNGTHSSVCTGCGNTMAAVSCTPNGTYTATGNGTHTSTCALCGGTTAAVVCSGSTWSTDENSHWKNCSTCSAKITTTVAAHTGTATCQSAATCTVCSKSFGSKGDHVIVEIEGKDPTCTDTGLSTGEKCSLCGTVTVEQTTLSAYGHVDVTLAGYAATCTTAGLTDGTKCFTCGQITLAQETIPATGHSYVDGVCTGCGDVEDIECTHEYEDNCATECSKCGAGRVAPHNPTAMDGYAATCTEKGLTDGSFCPDCGTILVEQEEIGIDTSNHTNLIDIEAADATCTENGWLAHKLCTSCGVAIDKVELVASHTALTTLEGTPATCTDTGLTDGEYCQACGEITVPSETIPALGHTEQTIPGVASTCTSPGLSDGKVCSVCDEITVEQEQLPLASHTQQIVAGVDATCTTDGHSSYTICSVCNGIIAEPTTLPATGHRNTTEIPGYAASCEASGLTSGAMCLDCDSVVTAQQIIPATGHQETEVISGYAATCTTSGLTDGTKCTACGKTVTAQEIIPATGIHTEVTIDAIDATCDEAGATEGKKCSVCGTVTVQPTEIEALGHSFTTYIYNNDAKCEEDGTETAKCDRCDATDKRVKAGSQLGHSFTNYVSDGNATCTANGTETAKCDRCDKTDTRTDDDSMVAHSYTVVQNNEEGHWNKCANCDATTALEAHDYSSGSTCACGYGCQHEGGEATCKVQAVCEICGQYYGELKAHSYTSKVTAPTCTTGGYTTYTCSVCSDTYTDDETEELGHSYSEVVTAPTCTVGGYTTYTCSACGDTYKGAETAAKGHTEETVEGYDATCTETGLTDGVKCSECGTVITEQQTIEALNHSFTNYVSDGNATCIADGTKTAKCDRCDETDTVDDVGSTLGHSFTTYNYDENATCTANGTETAKCDRCDKTDTRTKAGTKLGHSFTDYKSDGNATCTENGTATAKCDRCDVTETITEADSALGHSFTNYVSNNNATCTENGTETAKCDRCNETNTQDEADSALGHDYSETVTAPTCTAQGYTTYTCQRTDCGHVKVDNYTAMAEHTLVTTPAVKPTTTTAGSTAGVHCSECDRVFVEVETVPALSESAADDDHVNVFDKTDAPIVSGATATGDHTPEIQYAAGKDNVLEKFGNDIHNAYVTAMNNIMKAGVFESIASGLEGVTPDQYHDLKLGQVFEIQDVADGADAYSGTYTVTLVVENAANVKAVLHYVGGQWVIVDGLSVDTTANTVTFNTTSFSPYALVSQEECAHNNAQGVVTAPTCTDAGYTTYTCADCGKVWQADEVASAGHSFTNYVSNKTDCTVAGTKTATCDNCTVTDTKTDPATEHTYDNAKDANCNVCNYERQLSTFAIWCFDNISGVAQSGTYTTDNYPTISWAGKTAPAMFTASGWAIANGGQAGYAYSVNGGNISTAWLYSGCGDAGSDVLGVATGSGVDNATAANGRFANMAVDLASYRGQTISIQLYVVTADGEYVQIANITDYAIATNRFAASIDFIGTNREENNRAQISQSSHSNGYLSYDASAYVLKEATFYFEGWVMIEGGQQDRMFYSVDGGITWTELGWGWTNAGSTAHQGVGNSWLPGVDFSNYTSATCWGAFALPAELHGQQVDLTFGRMANNGEIVNFVTFRGLNIPGTATHDCVANAIASGWTPTGVNSGVHATKCGVCGKNVYLACSAGTEYGYDADSHWTKCTLCDGIMGEKVAHSGGSATCTTPASCTVCGQNYGSIGGGHTIPDGLTCTDDKYCTECGQLAEAGKAHTETTVPGKAPTCNDTGLTDGVACSVCGETITPQEEIDALGHDWSEEYSSDAEYHWFACENGCDEINGKTAHDTTSGSCVCGVECPHTTTDTIPAQSPTCTDTGKTAGAKCSVCGKIVTPQEEVDALGHDWSTEYTSDNDNHWFTCNNGCEEISGKAAHDTTSGTCVCGFGCPHTTTELVSGTAATCTAAGRSDGQRCTVCGNIVSGYEIIPALGHTEVTVPGKAATCTETGLTDGVKCSVCGETLTAQQTISALGHTEVTVPGKAATCTETGLTDGVKCSACGKTLTAQQTIPAKGHAFTDSKDTTCNNGCGYVRVVDTKVVWSFDSINSVPLSGLYYTGEKPVINWATTGQGGAATMNLAGWAITSAGQSGLYYSLDGGSTMLNNWIATGLDTAEQGVLDAAIAGGIDASDADGTNGRFRGAAIDLSAYAGQSVNVKVYVKTNDGEYIEILTVNGFTVATTYKGVIDFIGTSSTNKTQITLSAVPGKGCITYDGSSLNSTTVFVQGWMMITGGQQSNIEWSVNNGTSWNTASGLTMGNGSNDHITSASTETGVSDGWVTTGATYNGTIDLSAYAGHTVTLTLSRVSTSGERIVFAYIGNVVVPGSRTHNCTVSSWTSSNDGHSHYGICTQCQVIVNGACTGGEYQHDDHKHWQVCSECSGVINTTKAAHAGSNATCQSQATCDTCGVKYGEIGQHVVDSNLTCDDDKYCTECGTLVSAAGQHTVTTPADCVTDAYCDACGKLVEEAWGHTPGAEATCTTAQTCTVCTAVITPAKGHSYENGVCTVCGEEQKDSFSGYINWVGSNEIGLKVTHNSIQNYAYNALVGNGQLRVAGWVVLDGGHQGFAYSLDGGATWLAFNGTITNGGADHAGVAGDDGIQNAVTDGVVFDGNIDLLAYRGQTVTVTFGVKKNDAEYVTVATISGVEVPTVADSIAAIDSVNGVTNKDTFNLPFLTTAEPGMINWAGRVGAKTLNLKGWALADGGQSGIAYSINGGAITSITNASYSDAGTDVLGAAADYISSATATNGRWENALVDLSAYSNQTITIDIYVMASNGTNAKILTITNYTVAGTSWAAIINTIDGVSGFSGSSGSQNAILSHTHITQISGTTLTIQGWMMADGGQKHLAWSVDGGKNWRNPSSTDLTDANDPAGFISTATQASGDASANWVTTDAQFKINLNLSEANLQGQTFTITLARVTAADEVIPFAKVTITAAGSANHAHNIPGATANGDGTHSGFCTVCTAETRTVCASDGQWYFDANSHWQVCAGCQSTMAGGPAAHTGGEANCQTQATCQTCNQLYGGLGDHVAPTDALCTDDKYCTVDGCGELIEAATEHVYGEEGLSEACDTKCNNCSFERTDAPHNPGPAASCTSAQVCLDCGAMIAQKLDHSVAEGTYCDEAWVCTVCGETIKEASACVPGDDATCTTDQVCTVCGKVLQEAYGHTPSADAPTCTDKVTCITCGETLEESLGGHIEGEGTVTAAPTCGNNGVMTYYCTREGCGEFIRSEEIPATGLHTAGPEATCTTDQTCTECGAVIKEKLGHQLVSVEGQAASCGAAGWEAHQVCETCGGFFDTEGNALEAKPEIPALNHDIVVVPKVEPTCGKDGYKGYEYCTQCDYTTDLKDDTMIEPATGAHIYDFACFDTDGKCNTCAQAAPEGTFVAHTQLTPANCITLATCSVCNQSYGEYDNTDHIFSNGCGDADCDRGCGYTRTEFPEEHSYAVGCDVDCDVCGYVRSDITHTWMDGWQTSETEHWKQCQFCGEKDQLNSHIYDNNCDADCNVCAATREPSDHVGGTATCIAKAVCTECGQEYGNLGDHTPNMENPSCTEDKVCTVCNDLLASKTGHDMSPTAAIEATCTTAGQGEYQTCNNCSKMFDMDENEITEIPVIDALGHVVVVDAAVEATCTGSGLTEGSHCSRCQEILVAQQVIDPLGHTDGGEWREKKAATCTAVGIEEEICTVCGSPTGNEREIEMIDHVWGDWVTTKDASCTEDGSRTRTCQLCLTETDTEVIPMTGHSTELQWITTTPTTCTTDGEQTGYCTNCNEPVQTRVLETEGHSMVFVETIEATCTTYGYDSYICSVCQEPEERNTVDALGHDKVYHEAKDATCTEIGWDAYETCNRCTEYNTYVEIPALEHDWTEWTNTKDPTCVATGEAERTCNRCDVTETKTLEIVDHEFAAEYTTNATSHWFKCNNCDETTTAEAHDFTNNDGVCATCQHVCQHEGGTASCTEQATCQYCSVKYGELKAHTTYTVSGFAATCTETGLTDGTACSECGQTLVAQETIKALGHSYTNYTSDGNATCTADGTKTASCDNNCGGTSTIPDENSAIGHAWDDESWETTNPATCTTAGERVRYCTNQCGEKQTETIDATGHTEATEWETTVPAGCLTAGTEVIRCTVCGEILQSKEIEATGHTWGAWNTVTEPDCTNDGQEVRYCEVCGTPETNTLPMTGHSHTTTVIAPTCETQGYTIYECHCGDLYEDDYVDALGHDYSEVVTAPTCTAQGYTTYTCQREGCGHTYVDNYTPVADHTAGETVKENVTDATCDTAGSYDNVVYCTECNAEISRETVEVGALGHDYDEVVTAPTCTAGGYTTYTCTVCQHTYTADEIPATGHTEETVPGYPAGCLTEGLTDGKKCTVCGQTTVPQQTIGMLGHNHEAGETVAPTCTEMGYTPYTCSRCGDTYNGDMVPAIGHAWDNDFDTDCNNNCGFTRDPLCEHAWDNDCDPECNLGCGTTRPITHITNDVEGKAATCTETGLEACKQCSVCNKYFDLDGNEIDAQVVIPALDHDTTTHEAQSATCTDIGWDEYVTCSRCDLNTYVEIPALGHDIIDVDGYDATCTETGLTDGKECSRCDYVEVEQSEIPATGHTEVIDPMVQASCTETGLTEGKHCSVCTAVIVAQQTIPATGHDNKTVVIAPTCEAEGYTIVICNNCGESTKSDIQQAIGHDYDWMTTKTPTCAEEGLAAEYCKNCNAQTGNTKTLDATGEHSEVVSSTTQATCTADGYTTYTCTVCGEERQETTSTATGHQNIETVITDKAPTCAEAGIGKTICTDCGATVETGVEIPKTDDHNYTVVITDPTCSEAGVKTYTCTICAGSYTEAGEPATGAHLYNKTVTKPTCTEAGQIVYTCECGDTYTETGDAATGHNYIATITPPTCEAGGYTYHECSDCEDSYTDSETSALGHSYSDWVVTTQPACGVAGSKYKVCTNCADKVTEEISALAHSYELVYETDSTCTEAGIKVTRCNACGDEQTETKALAEHTWGDWVTTQAPTCTAEGTQKKVCAICGDEQTQSIDKVAHEYTSATVAPTCTAGGYTTHTCACGDSYTDSETAALDHSFTTYVSNNDATCTEDGTMTATCDRCDAEDIQIDAGSAKGHNHAGVVTAPTCTTAGYTTYTCACGDTYTADEVNALGHASVRWEQTSAPDCTNTGLRTEYCNVCGEATGNTETIAAIGHSYNVTVVNATCTSDGYIEYICSECNDTYRTNEVEAAGHDSVWITESEATCTTAGYKKEICTKCGTELNSESTPATEHSYTITYVTEPTCESQGYTTFICESCGDSYKENFTDAGHVIVTDAAIDATCTTAGLTEGSHCSRCGYVEVEQTLINALGHLYDDIADMECNRCDFVRENTCTHAFSGCLDTDCDLGCGYERVAPGHVEKTIYGYAATCTQTGMTDGKICVACNAVLQQQTEITELASHTLNRESASCTENSYCTVCGYVSGIAVGHTTGNFVVGTDATCTTYGIEYEVCSVCGDSTGNSRLIDKKAHTEGAWITDIEPTCGRDGHKYTACTECGYVMQEETVMASGEHKGGNATCQSLAACEVCGQLYGVIGEHTAGAEATCTAAQKCTLCGTEMAPAKGHSWDDGVVTGATCTAKAYTTYTCTVCDETKVEFDDGELAGHTAGQSATCTDAQTCTVCGAVIAEALGHMGGEADCSTLAECDRCGQTYGDYDNTKHTYDNTCDAFCNGCGEERETSHTQKTVTGTPATCTVSGLTDGVVCSVCGETLVEQDVIPATGHAYDNAEDTECNNGCGTVRVPICAEHTYDSCEDLDCNVCEYVRESAAEHAYSGDCDTTCDLCEGVREAVGDHLFANACDTTCDNCGSVREVSGHEYSTACDDTCMHCGAVDASRGHTGGSATCKDRAVCTSCGEAYGELSDAHTYENACDTVCDVCGVTRVAEHSYTASGRDDTYHWISCDICGEKSGIEVHKFNNACDSSCDCGYERATNHVFGGCEDTDCDLGCGYERAAGQHSYSNDCDAVCNVCGEVRAISDTHRYDNDCDADCNNCGSVRAVDGHKYDNSCDADCNVCGDTREIGGHVYSNACDTTCNVCGEVRDVEGHVATDAGLISDASHHWYVCAECAMVFEKKAHVYGMDETLGQYVCTDKVCDECGYEATVAVGAHEYDHACDADCNVCGAQRTPDFHVYTNDCDTDCNVCGDIREVDVHQYLNPCATTCIVCQYVRWDEADAPHLFVYDCQSKCVNCDLTRAPLAEHNYERGYDDLEHWMECSVCGNVNERGEHTVRRYTSLDENLHRGQCAGCKEYLVSNHTWDENGVCTASRCGEKFQPEGDYVVGDIDNDGDVDADDAIYLLMYVEWGEDFYPVKQPGDFTGNGATDADDAIYLLMHVEWGEDFYPLRAASTYAILPTSSKKDEDEQ